MLSSSHYFNPLPPCFMPEPVQEQYLRIGKSSVLSSNSTLYPWTGTPPLFRGGSIVRLTAVVEESITSTSDGFPGTAKTEIIIVFCVYLGT